MRRGEAPLHGHGHVQDALEHPEFRAAAAIVAESGGRRGAGRDHQAGDVQGSAGAPEVRGDAGGRAGSMDRFAAARLVGVRRLALFATLSLSACASRPPMEKPTIRSVPPALLADSGASLYVLEGRDDWVDELGPELPKWIGPQALEKILRYG